MIEKKCIFIHIPKVAGTSIRNALGAPERPRDHYEYRLYLHSHSGKFEDYFKFCFVRNPWSRLFSTYNYLSKGGNQNSDLAFINDKNSSLGSFEQFVKQFLTVSSISRNVILRPQSSYIYDDHNNLMVDFVGKVESIQEDFQFIKEKLELATNLEKLNTSTSNDYRKFYSSKLVDLVEEAYKEDIENFAYRFE